MLISDIFLMNETFIQIFTLFAYNAALNFLTFRHLSVNAYHYQKVSHVIGVYVVLQEYRKHVAERAAEGIVPKPGRSVGGRGLYASDEIAKLRFVRRCRDLGFPISIVKTFLSLAEQNDCSCGEVKTIAEGHLDEISAKIENLLRLREALLDLSKNCDDGTSACPMLEALMKDGFGNNEIGQGGH